MPVRTGREGVRKTLYITVGRLLCGQARNYLAERKVRWGGFDFHEGRGWIERQFTISGDAEIIYRIGEELELWFKRLDACDKKRD